MSAIRLKPGETAVVVAVDPKLYPDHGLPPPEQPVDPGYGIDLGLGFLRPNHDLPTPQPPVPPDTAPVDPEYGVDEDIGYVRPEHPIVLPPPAPGKPEINWELKTGWTPTTGWVVFAVPTGPTPTPSKRR